MDKIVVNHLHIVSFDIPFPANYGGVIDVFYKVKYLSEQNIKVHLHCFEYGRAHSSELEDICESVNYYSRKTRFTSHLSNWPYIVKSRISEPLIQNLISDNYPILFEGMHTMGVGLDKRLSDRKKIYRESNIEHHYYNHLYKAEKNPLKKFFYKIESWKLKQFEKNILKFDKTLVVSQADLEYLQENYPSANILYLPSFHPNQAISTKKGQGNYALYNGNLSVVENILAVEYLIVKVFSKLDYPFIVAGLEPSDKLKNLIDKYSNISLKKNLSDHEMTDLIQNAQFNILTTAQATGLKLKLLNTLYQGRFCIVNDKMVSGTGLSELCIIANSPDTIIEQITKYSSSEFSEIADRERLLKSLYDNKRNILKLIELLD